MYTKIRKFFCAVKLKASGIIESIRVRHAILSIFQKLVFFLLLFILIKSDLTFYLIDWLDVIFGAQSIQLENWGWYMLDPFNVIIYIFCVVELIKRVCFFILVIILYVVILLILFKYFFNILKK